jgi:hypothetical protein
MPFVWWGSDGTPQDGGHCLQGDALPDPDDPATAGCLLALLGDRVNVYGPLGTDDEDNGWEVVLRSSADERTRGRGSTLGRACIAAAEAIGLWPGGAA